MLANYEINANSINNNYLENNTNLKANDNLINLSHNNSPNEFATVTPLNKTHTVYGNDLAAYNNIIYPNSKNQINNNYAGNNINYLNNLNLRNVSNGNIINNPSNYNNLIQPSNNALFPQNQNLNPNIINVQNNNVLLNNKNNNALVNNQNNNRINKSNGIQSNDFWQKIDRRKHSNSNNNAQNSIISPNRRSNNNNDSEQMNQVLDDFFGDFFNNEGHNQVNSNQVQIRMGSSPDEDLQPHIYFQSFFSPFGINGGAFRQNYSSNFGNQLATFMNLLQRGRRGPAHPPATREALSKLKRFPLIERFCKKKNGKLELPNCCICQCEIELGKETVLLPCGHMYHWDCCLHWLKTNNTCPMCRFEIK